MNNVKLFLVATPIGNLGDFSKRAIDTLNNVDAILCEDTRVTIKLSNYFNIKKPLISYNEYSSDYKLQNIIDDMLNGKTFAIVSDAGMPCISDPGEELVNLCHKNNIKISVITGANALISALSVSGLNCTPFTFVGFLDKEKSERYEQLDNIKHLTHTLVFYETPHRLKKCLDEFLNIFGDRQISLVREITKIYEEINLTTISEAISYYENIPPRGEFVLVVDGFNESTKEKITIETAIAMAMKLIKKGYSTKDASKVISVETSFKKGDIYKGLLNK